MRSLVTLLGALTLLAACGATPPPATGTRDPAPLDPMRLGMTCDGGDTTFSPARLSDPGGAEGAADPRAAALRQWLASEGGEMPADGWIRVVETPTHVQFVRRDPKGEGYLIVGFFRREGAWQLDLAGRCRGEVVLPDGVGRATWRLDPGRPRPAPGDRLIPLLINEVGCASGQSPEGRVLDPVVDAEPDGIGIAVLVAWPQGDVQSCQSNPELDIEVQLPEAWGGRPLFDIAVFPPARSE